MELRTLSYFLAVAREQNMTEAANVLHVTQPTLSRQIADLEDELGKKLFTRTSRSTILTEDGMHLRQRAEEILTLVNQTEDELKNDTIDLSGCIRIGAGETHAMHILADLFADLHGRYPRLTVELFTGNADAVEEKLAHGLIAFAPDARRHRDARRQRVGRKRRHHGRGSQRDAPAHLLAPVFQPLRFPAVVRRQTLR